MKKKLLTTLLIFVFSALYLNGKAKITFRVQDDSTLLRNTVNRFLQEVDNVRTMAILATYDPEFVSIRVVDDGKFFKMDLNQMTGFWHSQSNQAGKTPGFRQSAIVTKSTTVHEIEITGEIGLVLLTRVKDLGSGDEPLFYTLVWRKRNNQWYLFREIVHQRTMPKF